MKVRVGDEDETQISQEFIYDEKTEVLQEIKILEGERHCKKQRKGPKTSKRQKEHEKQWVEKGKRNTRYTDSRKEMKIPRAQRDIFPKEKGKQILTLW